MNYFPHALCQRYRCFVGTLPSTDSDDGRLKATAVIWAISMKIRFFLGLSKYTEPKVMELPKHADSVIFAAMDYVFLLHGLLNFSTCSN